MKIVLGTHNKHKVQEIKEILPDSIVCECLSDIGFLMDLEESGNTFQANAIQKVKQLEPFFADRICISEDSGLEVAGLGGEPGVFSARYAGSQRNDHENVKKLLQKLEGETDRSATFTTVIALLVKGETHIFEGRCNGDISLISKGENGFGYDPVFIPKGSTLTFAEMSGSQKNLYSHRAKALEKLKIFLLENNFLHLP